MSQDVTPSKSEMPIIQLLPNLLTLAAICAGLTAIRFGFQGDFHRAVLLILVASLLDAFDGKLARLLKCESQMGAELDSLADFLNFGVAAPMLIYLFAFQEARSVGWISVLFFSVCCVIRLARFNVASKSKDDEEVGKYFVGVPAPAGALLILFPMFFSFLFSNAPIIAPLLICVWMVTVGFLMISRIPTYSVKTLTIPREKQKFVLLGFVILLAAMLTYLWATLAILDVLYIVGVVWAWRTDRSQRKSARV